MCQSVLQNQEETSKQSVTVNLAKPQGGNSLNSHGRFFNRFFFFGGEVGKPEKCLLYTAVEAGLSVEDSGLLSDCELNEET